jgi:hypothetical protein
MADLYERLFCFGKCQGHVLVVKRRARKTTKIKCKARAVENTIESIKNAMRLRGIQPKRHPTPTTRS